MEMERSRWRPSPGTVFGLLALVVAVAGTAIAGPLATKSRLNKKERAQVRKIVKKQINQRTPALETVGRQAVAAIGTNGCFPSGGSYFTCASVDLNLPSPGRVLLIGDVSWYSDTSPTNGACRLMADGTQVGSETAFVGELVDASDPSHQLGQGLNGVTNSLSAGRHHFTLQCVENLGGISFPGAWLSAVKIGAA
jgi:hypothetical protein